jgi:hypothetical protein
MCFSATGNTRGVARALAGAIGADYLEIEPEQPYTEHDLDYDDETTRATVEQRDGTARPGIASAMPEWGDYDVILFGHPIWWETVPRIMCTLFEQNAAALAGKRLADFCTSGGSGIGRATDELKGIVPDAEWGVGRRFEASASAEEVAAWAQGLGF